MPTYQQLIRLGRTKPLNRRKTFDLKQHGACGPQRRGYCNALKIITPKKPNSARRRVALLSVSLGNNLSSTNNRVERRKNVYVYVPGEDTYVPSTGDVLFRGGRPKDLPGIRYKMILGKFGVIGTENKKNSRSKCGLKKEQERFFSIECHKYFLGE